MNTSTPLGRRINRWGHLGIAVLCLSFAFLGGRLVHIHVSHGERLRDYRDRRQQRAVELPARRGSILDRRGRLLAGSEKRPSVFADPRLFEASADIGALAVALGMVPQDIQARIAERAHSRFCWLARRIEPETAQFVRQLELKGIGVIAEPRRFYPHGGMLAQVLGFVGADELGQAGLEREYDDTLLSTAGRFSATCDRDRRMLWSVARQTLPAEDGFALLLTIDLFVQKLLEKEVAGAVERFAARSGVGIVIDPDSGQILAMTSQPSFDLNDRAALAAAVRRNLCLDPVEPGSVFKPFIMAAAINEGVTHPDEEIDCGPGVHYFGRRAIHDTHPNNVLTVENILVESSNIGMGILAERLGNAALLQYLERFGFRERSGIDLPAESRGIVNGLEHWNSYSTQSVAMGQEIAVTPLQLASAFAALVNGGVLRRPYIVQAIIDPTTGRRYTREPEVLRQVVPERCARTVAQRMLRKMVRETHHDVNSTRYAVLGKTGTAQVPFEDRRGYKPDAYRASFMGAAPAGRPRLAAVVMIHEPDRKLGYYGGVVAGPAVRNVLDAALAYLGVPADPPDPPPDELASSEAPPQD